MITQPRGLITSGRLFWSETLVNDKKKLKIYADEREFISGCFYERFSIYTL